jgi:hypothetical protein
VLFLGTVLDTADPPRTKVRTFCRAPGGAQAFDHANCSRPTAARALVTL